MEKFESPESQFPEYESLSEAQKELLRRLFGIENGETYESQISGDLEINDPALTPEEVRDLLRQTLEQEQ